MLLVNLVSGPGAGKSTTAAFIFAKLKMAGVNPLHLTVDGNEAGAVGAANYIVDVLKGEQDGGK